MDRLQQLIAPNLSGAKWNESKMDNERERWGKIWVE